MKIRIIILCTAFILFGGLPLSAQSGDNCPANITLMLARSGAACSASGRNMACYGNGAVSAAFYDDAATWDKPGDRAAIGQIEHIRTGDNGEWGVASLQVQANLPDTQQRSTTFLAFGDVEIRNEVPPTPEITLVSTGTVNIRTRPNTSGDIIERVGVRGAIIANGRTADSTWLRVMSPVANVIGWVSAQAPITIDGNVSSLNIADPAETFHRPYQVFSLRTARSDAPCTGAPNSGLLVQTPNTFEMVDFVINGLPVRLAATVFIQADDVLTVNVLDGQAEAGGGEAAWYAPAGAKIEVALDADGRVSAAPGAAVPYDMADVAALPINNLAYRFSIPAALTQVEIDERVTAYQMPRPSPVSPEERASTQCVRRTLRDATLWAGPGRFYEAINEISRGTQVFPVLQVRDGDGVIWWQLRNSNWLRAALVESSGTCPEVPFTDFVRSPATNTLSLETCETTNGQLRVGQRVTITFLPPAWETLADAQAAARIDPGTITVNGVRLGVGATAPQRIAEERYIRTFSATWTATAGSQRIEGKRLAYIAICNLTVPVG